MRHTQVVQKFVSALVRNRQDWDEGRIGCATSLAATIANGTKVTSSLMRKSKMHHLLQRPLDGYS